MHTYDNFSNVYDDFSCPEALSLFTPSSLEDDLFFQLWQIDGETMETVTYFIFLGSKITADGDYSHEVKMLAPWKKSYDQHRQHIKKQRHYFVNKGPSDQSYGFSRSHVWI